MRKKVLISILTTIIISLLIVGGLFMVIFNYQHMENTKQDLKLANSIVIKSIKSQDDDGVAEFLKSIYEDSPIRITYIRADGRVIFDSDGNYELADNHLSREEVEKAIENGEGSSTRFSDTLDKNMIYYATVMENGDIIRSSIAVDNVYILKSDYTQYYIGAIVIVILLAIIFTTKLTHAIVEPLKELQFVTSRIAKGDLKRRANIKSNDEIGKLANTFNDMADKLEISLGEATDRQNKLEAILKSMDSGVVAIDKNHKIIIMNPYAKEIFGVERNIIGENLMDHIRDFELEGVFTNEHEGYREIKILWPRERILRVRTTDIISDGGLMGTVAAVQDVTDVKRLENMRSEFVANVSHELKTPLTSIKGFAETLKYVNDEKNKEKFLGIINDEAERLTRLIEDILTLSNIEQHKDEVFEEINIKEELSSICYIMRNSSKSKNIEIIYSCEEVNYVFGSKDRFKQMMINLIDNAIKYSDKGSKVWVSASAKSGFVNIKIKDQGVGIPKEHMPRLFERFYRVDKARSRAAGGTGLGLAIVKHIVLEFKGNIDIQSELGKGSEFVIMLPEVSTRL
ncbi:MAG: cell wall metabolism sensor histidine kinase WalK [Clostridium sp.]|uniref:two-component system histidine kinase PnpS n=1 Tax=Clostridium sp. TaxID=1506 RepID=UPI002A8C5AEB|nr:cell wall metabolism sensor histidine kinase WalK [Clostridium sp.]MDY5098098.1 ATP-binding protein [Clostridium sp.]